MSQIQINNDTYLLHRRREGDSWVVCLQQPGREPSFEKKFHKVKDGPDPEDSAIDLYNHILSNPQHYV